MIRRRLISGGLPLLEPEIRKAIDVRLATFFENMLEHRSRGPAVADAAVSGTDQAERPFHVLLIYLAIRAKTADHNLLNAIRYIIPSLLL